MPKTTILNRYHKTEIGQFDLANEDMRSKNLSEADFSYQYLSGVVFDGSNLCDASFSNSTLDDCSFRGCDARFAKFINANLRNCDATNCNLTGSDLRGCVWWKE